MNILIIENVSTGSTKYGLFDKTILTMFSILPTLYARQIKAITPKKHNTQLINERYDKIDYNQNYDIVNINYTTSTTPRAYQIADKFQKKDTTLALSGMHASALPEEAIQHADSVLIGRGETNWLEFLDDFEKKQIKRIYQPKPYKKISIPPTQIELPGFVINGAIEATRGCPYQCTFCPESNIPRGNIYYQRPVDDVIEEIKKLPYKTFNFYDNSLTINPTYTKTLFKKMKPLNKKFSCNGNSDVLANDIELVKLSKEAGCKSWLIGFESFQQETIELVGKKTNKIKEYQKAVENIHNNNMVVIGDFMFGFDTDTKDVFDNTLKMLKKLKIDAADFTILTPFPGTPIFETFEKEDRLLTKDWSKYNMRNVVFKPKNLTPQELTNGVRKMYKEFYSTPYAMKRIISSLKLGFYQFLLVFSRNFIANMNSKRL